MNYSPIQSNYHRKAIFFSFEADIPFTTRIKMSVTISQINFTNYPNHKKLSIK